VLQEAIQTITERIRHLERLDDELSYHVKNWRYYPVVKAIQAMRGVRLLVDVGVIAGLGDLSRFDHPRKLMSYLRLVSSEHSSGGKRKQSGITRTGNARARRLLVVGAHTYRYAANISTELQKRQESLSKEVMNIAWQAIVQAKRGKHYNVVVTAIAREMLAYIWAISREVVLTPVNPAKRLARVPV
jgi:transposase